MRKKYLSALLFGALLFASAGTFTSCKDYDDDINNLQTQIDKVASDLESLKTTVDNLGGVTDVKIEGGKLLVTAGGQTISYDLPAGADVEQTTVELDGQDLKVNGEVIGQVGDKVTVNEDGYLCVNGTATAIKAGKYAVLDNDANGVVTITLPDANGELKTINLSKASSAITGLTITVTDSYLTGGKEIAFSEKYLSVSPYDESQHGIYWGVASSDMNDWTGTLGAIKKGQILVGQISTATVTVTPATFDLNNVKLTLVDTKGNTAPATISASKSSAKTQNTSTSGSRAAANDGCWTLSIVPTTDDMGNAFAVNDKNIVYALAADGIVLTPYNIIVDTKTDADVAGRINEKPTFTDGKLKIGDVADASNAFASVELGDNKIVYEEANICDIQVDIAQESIDDAELLGITLDKTTNTLKVSDKAANAGSKIKLNVVLLDANGKKSDSKTFTITKFGTTSVNDDDKVTLATTNYTLTPSTNTNAKNIIIDVEDVFSSLTAEQSTALTTVSWTSDENFLTTSISDVKYFADETDAKKNDDNKDIAIDDNTAGRVRSIKYAVIPLTAYDNDATAGEHKLEITLSTAKGDIKKVIVPVNVVVPAFTDIFTKTANQWDGDTFATTLLSEATSKTVLGYATAFNKTVGTAYDDIKISFAKVKNEYIVDDNTDLSSDAKVGLTKANIVDANTGSLKATAVSTTVVYSFSDNITTEYTFTTEIHSIFEGPELVYYKNGAIVETAEVGANGLIAPLSYKSDGVTPVTGLAIKYGKDVKPFKADQAVDGITLKASAVSDTNIQVYTQISVKDVQSATTSFSGTGASVTNVNQGTLVATFTDANGVITKAEIPFLK